MAKTSKINTQEAKDLVVDFFLASEKSTKRTAYLDDYERHYKKYLLYKTDREYALKKAKQDWRSNLYVPLVFSTIETFVPNATMSVVMADPIVVMKANSREDVPAAKVAERLCHIQAHENDFVLKFGEWVRDAAIGGLGIAAVSWRKETIIRPNPKNVVRVIELPGGMKVPIPKVRFTANREEVVVADLPDFNLIDPFDWFPDDTRTNIKDMRGCGRQFIQSEKEVESFLDGGAYTSRSEYNKLMASQSFEDLTPKESRRLQAYDNPFRDSKGMRVFLIKEYMENDRLIYVANNKYVLRNTDNPNWHKQKHYVDIKVNPIPHQYWPKGLVWPSEDIQIAMNDLYNQRADNVKFLLNNMVKVMINDILYESDLKPRPGGVVRVKNPDAYSPVPAGNVTQDAYSHQADLMAMNQNATGMFDIVRGHMQRRETATVGMQLARSAGIRLQNAIWHIATSGVKRVWELMMELNRQYLSTPRMIEMVGIDEAEGIPQFIDASRIDMPQGKVNMIPKVSIEQQVDIERAWMERYFKMFYGIPEVDSYALVQAATDSAPFRTRFNILKSPDEYAETMEKLGGMIPEEIRNKVSGGGSMTKPPAIAQPVTEGGGQDVLNQAGA